MCSNKEHKYVSSSRAKHISYTLRQMCQTRYILNFWRNF